MGSQHFGPRSRQSTTTTTKSGRENSMTLLFEETLKSTMPAPSLDDMTPLCDEGRVTEDDIIIAFATLVAENDDEVDANSLEGVFDQFVEYHEVGHLSDGCKDAIREATTEAFGSAGNENVKSLLKTLAKTPNTTQTTPDQYMHPLAGEGGVRRFLRQLKIQKHGYPYGNDDAFSAKDVKTFDRGSHRYGKPYSTITIRHLLDRWQIQS
jgi:hypothetical protein